MARRILLGRIAGAHGVRGELRVQSFTADPAAIASYGPLADKAGAREFRLALRGRVRGDQLIVHVDGIDDRNAADALKGTELYVERERLPPTADTDEYYEADLVGLDVVDRQGRALGTVSELVDYGAGPILVVKAVDGSELLLPFSDAMVPEIDLAAGRLVAEPPAEIEVRPEDAAAGAAGHPDARPAGRRGGGRR